MMVKLKAPTVKKVKINVNYLYEYEKSDELKQYSVSTQVDNVNRKWIGTIYQEKKEESDLIILINENVILEMNNGSRVVSKIIPAQI